MEVFLLTQYHHLMALSHLATCLPHRLPCPPHLFPFPLPPFEAIWFQLVVQLMVPFCRPQTQPLALVTNHLHQHWSDQVSHVVLACHYLTHQVQLHQEKLVFDHLDLLSMVLMFGPP